MRIKGPRGVFLTAGILLFAVACGGTAATPPVASPVAATQAAEPTATADSPAPSATASSATESVVPATAATGIDIETQIPAGAAKTAASLTDAGPLVEPDPNYKDELDDSSISTRGWKTDFSRHTVPFFEILSGGPPRDGIPPIDNPVFIEIPEANAWIDDKEPVISLEINGVTRAYPLQILTWHEIVNDEFGGVPVAVTFCPLCNSAIAFDRRLDGVVYDFGTSGSLRFSDLIMWDRQTESWWQQLSGEAIIGELAGRRLTMLPASIISWSDFKAANPDSQVLSKDTGHPRDYGRNPYAGYDQADRPPFLYDGIPDGRLLPKERVLALSINGADIAFPFLVLENEGAVNQSLGGQDVAVFFKKGTLSALDSGTISLSRDVGSTGVFDANLDGRKLTFRSEADKILDQETGSEWNILGQAVDGPLAGSALDPIIHGNHFWFAWAAFKLETTIYQGTG